MASQNPAQSSGESTAIAVLFSYDPVTEETTADPIVAVEGLADPITRAYLLLDSIEADFPGRIWSVSGNEQAHAEREKALVGAVLGPEPAGRFVEARRR